MAKKKKKKTTKKKTAKRTAKKGTRGGKKRKPNKAFMAPLTPSPALAAVVGSKALPRTQVIKKLWQYIKSHKLQDPNNKRNIRGDEKMTKIFNGKHVVSMFEMTKLVNRHLKAA